MPQLEEEKFDPAKEYITVERVITSDLSGRKARSPQQQTPLTVEAMEELLDTFSSKLATELENAMVRALVKVFGPPK